MRVFVTGMAGTLGTALAKLHAERGDTVTGCSRNELNGIRWRQQYGELGQLYTADAFQFSDVSSPLGRALLSVDRLYHCAAMKHVQVCEAHPIECMSQNVTLTWFLDQACKTYGVPLVLASSDKAFRPEGIYGASKLMAERIVLGNGSAAVRLVNIIGSSGSVLAAWADAVKRGERIKLTDPEMTRYFMTVEEAAQLMAEAKPGLTVADAKAVRMGRLAECLAWEKTDVVGPRAGETQHQWLDEHHCSETDKRRWEPHNLAKLVTETRS